MMAIDYLTKLTCSRNEAAKKRGRDRRRWLNEAQSRDIARQNALSVYGDKLRTWIDRDVLMLSVDEIQELQDYFKEEWK